MTTADYNTTANQIWAPDTDSPYMVNKHSHSPQFLSAQNFNVGAALSDFWWSDGMGFQLGVIEGYLEQKKRN